MRVVLDAPGFRQIAQDYHKLGEDLRHRMPSLAMRDGIAPLLQRYRQLVPRGAGPAVIRGKSRKRWKNAIGNRVGVFRDGLGVWALVGTKWRDAPHGLWVDKGTQQRIRSQRGIRGRLPYIAGMRFIKSLPSMDARLRTGAITPVDVSQRAHRETHEICVQRFFRKLDSLIRQALV